MIETMIRDIVVPTSSHIPEIGSRLYVSGLPESVTYPAVVMYSVSRVDEIHETTLKTDRVQFSCYSTSLYQSDYVAEAIKDKIKRYYGQPSTSYGYKIIRSYFGGMNYIYESEIFKHVKILDMMINYLEV